MKRFGNVLLLFVLIAPTATYAIDSNGNFAIWGKGNQSCYNYISAKDTDNITHYKNYIMGFLTALNIEMEDTYRIAGRMNLEDILAWLDEYCDSKPIHSFQQALSNFTLTHYDKRLKHPPSQFRR